MRSVAKSVTWLTIFFTVAVVCTLVVLTALRSPVTGAVVEMKFDVESSVPVGADSTLDIKLLTPLGGHYVSLD
ncbi:MAG TPA: hypothetical protein VGA66_09815, partial [Mycobacterium sp.]